MKIGMKKDDRFFLSIVYILITRLLIKFQHIFLVLQIMIYQRHLQLQLEEKAYPYLIFFNTLKYFPLDIGTININKNITRINEIIFFMSRNKNIVIIVLIII